MNNIQMNNAANNAVVARANNTVTLNHPQAYIGTYKKYNDGSLAGGWLDLVELSTWNRFYEACKQLHRDESDPEFMCQDVESMPEGVQLPEDFSEQDFEDVITAYNEELERLQEESAGAEPDDATTSAAPEPRFQVVKYSEKALAVYGDTKEIKDKLKELGGRFNPRLRGGAGWIFSIKAGERLQALLSDAAFLLEPSAAAPSTRDTRKDSNVLANELKKNLEEYISLNNFTDPDYYKKCYVGAVKIQVKGEIGFYLLDKESIDTRFCFHDEGPDYENYLRVTSTEEKKKAYFKSKNLRSIRFFDVRKKAYYIYLDERKKVCFAGYNWQIEGAEIMTAEQAQAINKGAKWQSEGFEKRLNAYLKRWGTSKLDFWTYWADR